jgi:hypothetical protein
MPLQMQDVGVIPIELEILGVSAHISSVHLLSLHELHSGMGTPPDRTPLPDSTTMAARNLGILIR